MYYIKFYILLFIDLIMTFAINRTLEIVVEERVGEDSVSSVYLAKISKDHVREGSVDFDFFNGSKRDSSQSLPKTPEETSRLIYEAVVNLENLRTYVIHHGEIPIKVSFDIISKVNEREGYPLARCTNEQEGRESVVSYFREIRRDEAIRIVQKLGEFFSDKHYNQTESEISRSSARVDDHETLFSRPSGEPSSNDDIPF